MAATAGKIDLFNMALGFIGTRTVASEREKTPEAEQCRLYWDRARRQALRDFPFPFAVRRERLAERRPPDAGGVAWRHAYALPDGCLRVLAVHGEDAGRHEAWALESDRDGALLYCDAPRASLSGIFDVEDVSRWDELFVRLMARRLAALIAVPLLRNNSAKVRELEELYRLELTDAQAQAAAESGKKRPPASWLAARESWT